LRASEKLAGKFIKTNLNEYDIPQSKIDEIYQESVYSEIFNVEEDNVSFYTGEKNKKHQKHGYGILLMANGEKYEGYWENDNFNLYGRYISAQGEVFEGTFNDFYLNGNGRLKSSEKTYVGEFLYGKRHGKGKEVSESEEFEGDFRNDKRHGQGIVKFKKSNNIYEGDFNAGSMTGICVFKWNNGDRYEGTVIEGVFEGKGKYFWKNGNEYEGSYENGLRKGTGLFKWKEGKIYKGEFFNNVPHGSGVLIDNGNEKPIRFLNGSVVCNSDNSINVTNNTNVMTTKKSLRDLSNISRKSKRVSF